MGGRLPRTLPWVLLAGAVLVAAWGWLGRAPAGTDGSGVIVSEIILPDSAPLAFIGSAPLAVGRTALALSPDGATLAYAAQRDSTTQLYLRPLDRDSAFPVPGTEGACCPLFSPDGAWLVFHSRDELRKVRLGIAGAPIPLMPVNGFASADWSDDGWLVVSDRQGGRTFRLDPETGKTEPMDSLLGLPRPLPGSGAFLIRDRWRNTIDVVLRRTGERRSLPIPGTDPRWVPTGHIGYTQQGALWLVPFDRRKLAVTGAPLEVLPDLRTESSWGRGQYAFAPTGLLVYARGGNGDLGRLVAVTRQGRVDTLPFPPAAFGCLALSPEGRRIVARVADPATGRWDLWAYDLAGGAPVRLTTSGDATCPSWTPDARVTHVRLDEGRATILSQSASGRELPVTLRTTPFVMATSGIQWSPDGKRATISPRRGTTGNDLLVLGLDGDSTTTVVADSPALEWGGMFSPDGKWIAYSSSESGQDEIYVQPWPLTGKRWRVSRNSGEEPLWAQGGRVLVYRNGPEWWRVTVGGGAAGDFEASEPELMTRGSYLNVSGFEYAMSKDGERLYLLAPASAEGTTTRLTVVSDWFGVVEGMVRRSRGE